MRTFLIFLWLVLSEQNMSWYQRPTWKWPRVHKSSSVSSIPFTSTVLFSIFICFSSSSVLFSSIATKPISLSLSSSCFTAVISISFLSITFIPFYSCCHFFLSLYRSSATFLSRSLISQLLPLLTSHRWFISTFSHFISNIAPFLLFPQFSNHKTLYFHPRILTFFSFISVCIRTLSQLCSLSWQNHSEISFLSALFSPVNGFPVLLSCHEDTHASVGLQYSCTDKLIHQLLFDNPLIIPLFFKKKNISFNKYRKTVWHWFCQWVTWNGSYPK